MEVQQGEEDIQTYLDEYKTACEKIKQQYEEVYKSLGQKIESAKLIRKQNIKISNWTTN